MWCPMMHIFIMKCSTWWCTRLTWCTIDADKLAHVVYEPGSKALEEIRDEFGKDILDDIDNTQIDRKKLGAIVFNDATSMSVSYFKI